ncbi:hypothetical protein A5699_25070 [Mycobacterium sp. E802]|nr:hypothetical protein A5699_25070 [Mycobacterium sp. E802]
MSEVWEEATLGVRSGAATLGLSLCTERSSTVDRTLSGIDDSAFKGASITSDNDAVLLDSSWAPAVFVSLSVSVCCAPPLLETVTPGATSRADDVFPCRFGLPAFLAFPTVVLSVAPDSARFTAEPSPDDAEFAALDVEESDEEVPVVSAAATPTPVASAATSQPVTTTPLYAPIRAVVWDVRRDGVEFAGALDEREVNEGLMSGLLAVMARLRCPRCLFNFCDELNSNILLMASRRFC